MDIEKFDPTVEELKKIVDVTREIVKVDLKDPKQIQVVRENRIALRDARVNIEKRGKEMRADALAFQKKVIAKEKELIGIIEPEEDRLAKIEEEAKALQIRDQRMQQLPARKAKLESIGDGVVAKDEEILRKDDIEFAEYFNQRSAAKIDADRIAHDKKVAEDERIRLEAQKKSDAESEAKRKREDDEAAEKRRKEQESIDADRKKLEDERRKVEEDRAAIERQKEADRVREQARIDAEKKAKEDADRKEQERLAAERKAEEDKKLEADRLAKQQAFKDFLASHGWTEESKGSFKIEDRPGEVILYKVLGSFKK